MLKSILLFLLISKCVQNDTFKKLTVQENKDRLERCGIQHPRDDNSSSADPWTTPYSFGSSSHYALVITSRHILVLVPSDGRVTNELCSKNSSDLRNAAVNKSCSKTRECNVNIVAASILGNCPKHSKTLLVVLETNETMKNTPICIHAGSPTETEVMLQKLGSDNESINSTIVSKTNTTFDISMTNLMTMEPGYLAFQEDHANRLGLIGISWTSQAKDSLSFQSIWQHEDELCEQIGICDATLEPTTFHKINSTENVKRLSSCGQSLGNEIDPWLVTATYNGKEFYGVAISKRHIMVARTLWEVFWKGRKQPKATELDPLIATTNYSTLFVNQNHSGVIEILVPSCFTLKCYKSEPKKYTATKILRNNAIVVSPVVILEVGEDLPNTAVCLERVDSIGRNDSFYFQWINETLRQVQKESLYSKVELKIPSRPLYVAASSPHKNVRGSFLIRKSNGRFSLVAIGLGVLERKHSYFVVIPIDAVCSLTGVCSSESVNSEKQLPDNATVSPNTSPIAPAIPTTTTTIPTTSTISVSTTSAAVSTTVGKMRTVKTTSPLITTTVSTRSTSSTSNPHVDTSSEAGPTNQTLLTTTDFPSPITSGSNSTGFIDSPSNSLDNSTFLTRPGKPARSRVNMAEYPDWQPFEVPDSSGDYVNIYDDGEEDDNGANENPKFELFFFFIALFLLAQ